MLVREYKGREYIKRVIEKIKEDFKQILWKLKHSDKEIWEYVLQDAFKEYPYFEIFYIIGEKGVQVSNNVIYPRIKYPIKTGKRGADRNEKPYFKMVKEGDIYISGISLSGNGRFLYYPNLLSSDAEISFMFWQGT